MKLSDVNIRTIIAVFIVIFGMASLVFVHMEDIVLGLIGGYIGAVTQYIFGSSKGSDAKDKTISDMTKTTQADGPGGSNPPPGDPDDK